MSEAILEAPAAARVQNSRASDVGRVNEFLTFRLGAEEYGIDILRVREIRSFEEPTRIANTEPWIRGVINLRGEIVPIVDMRLRFRLADVSISSSTVTIVLSMGTQAVGMVVDAVSDVVTLNGEQMREAPAFGSAVDSEHILAIGAIEHRMLILVDIVMLMKGAVQGLGD